jgi:hypothetical protein
MERSHPRPWGKVGHRVERTRSVAPGSRRRDRHRCWPPPAGSLRDAQSATRAQPRGLVGDARLALLHDLRAPAHRRPIEPGWAVPRPSAARPFRQRPGCRGRAGARWPPTRSRAARPCRPTVRKLTIASSSSTRLSMVEAKSADSFSTSSPSDEACHDAARGCRNRPTAPTRPPAPDRSASARADCPHPCVAVVAMAEIRDDQADRQIAASHHLPHLAHHRIGGIAVVHRADPAAAFAVRTISSPSSTVMVIGFSHSTWKPASRNALVISKWVELGVATVTRSMRSGGSARPPASRASRHRRGPRDAERCA